MARGTSAAHSGPRQVPDPHAWQDLRLGPAYVRTIAAALAAADPATAPTLPARAPRPMPARLERAGCLGPRAGRGGAGSARRKVVTSHDAFGYFGAAYGVAFLAPQGVSRRAEPSAAAGRGADPPDPRRGHHRRLPREHGASPPRWNAWRGRPACSVRGRLYADALSEPSGPAPTYEAMFRHNVGLLVPAMRGDAA